MINVLTAAVWILCGALLVLAFPQIMSLDWGALTTQEGRTDLLDNRSFQIGGLLLAAVIMTGITTNFLNDARPDVGSVLILCLVFGLPLLSVGQVILTEGASDANVLVLFALIASQGAALLISGLAKSGERRDEPRVLTSDRITS